MMFEMFGCKITDDSCLTAKTDSLRNSAAFIFFSKDVEAKFQDLDTLSSQLGYLSSHMDWGVFPENVYTLISPYRQSIMTVNSTALFIALNHYMGSEYAPYESFPAYERRNKTPERIPYDVTEAIIRAKYPFEPESASLLNVLAYEGAVKILTMQSIKEPSLATALGWTDEQIKWAYDNEHAAWTTMAEREMIYSESGVLKTQMTGPAPSTSALHPDSPGRLGIFLGLRLIDSYLQNNPNTKASDFLNKRVYNSQTLLRDSGYRP